MISPKGQVGKIRIESVVNEIVKVQRDKQMKNNPRSLLTSWVNYIYQHLYACVKLRHINQFLNEGLHSACFYVWEELGLLL
jgi:hypothetical protein